METICYERLLKDIATNVCIIFLFPLLINQVSNVLYGPPNISRYQACTHEWQQTPDGTVAGTVPPPQEISLQNKNDTAITLKAEIQNSHNQESQKSIMELEHVERKKKETLINAIAGIILLILGLFMSIRGIAPGFILAGVICLGISYLNGPDTLSSLLQFIFIALGLLLTIIMSYKNARKELSKNQCS